MKKGILSFYLIVCCAIVGIVMMIPGTDKETVLEQAEWLTVIRLLGVLAIGSLLIEYLPPFLNKLKGESLERIASRAGLIVFVILVLTFSPLKEMETEEQRMYTKFMVVAVILILYAISFIWSRHIKKREEKEVEDYDEVSKEEHL